MAAPTTPTPADYASRGESEILAAIVAQARRCETAKGGTPPTSPTLSDLKAGGAMRCYVELLSSLRRLENLLP